MRRWLRLEMRAQARCCSFGVISSQLLMRRKDPSPFTITGPMASSDIAGPPTASVKRSSVVGLLLLVVVLLVVLLLVAAVPPAA